MGDGVIVPPEGFQERYVDGYWGVQSALDAVEADVRREMEGDETAVLQWRVLRKKS